MDPDIAEKSLQPISFQNLPLKEEDFLKKISSYSRFVVFSPHLDDAILSMGDLILYLDRLGKPIDIVNVFTQGSSANTPLTKRLLNQAGYLSVEDYFLKRREEDRRAFRIFGNAFPTYLDFSDAAWRKDRKNKILYPETAVTSLNPSDKVDEDLGNVLSKISCIVDDALVFSPIACGDHVDHQIVRNTVTNIFQNIIYYLDFPYSLKFSKDNEFIKENKLESIVCSKTRTSVKRGFIHIYTSQYVSFAKYDEFHLQPETYFLPSAN